MPSVSSTMRKKRPGSSSIKASRSDKPKKTRRQKALDEEVTSSEEDERPRRDEAEVPGASGSDDETEQDARLRLAREYLSQLDEDKIEETLRQDVAQKEGTLKHLLAAKFSNLELVKFCRNQHKQTVTCACHHGDLVYTGSKDCTIIQWKISPDVVKLRQMGGYKAGCGPSSHVLSLAGTSDGTRLASGEMRGNIHLWSTPELVLLSTYTGHRGGVSGLAFRIGSHQLFSGSLDRVVKVWDVSQGGYIETLYGHTDKVQTMDALSKERCLSAGARDASCRVWKLLDDSQLLFQAHQGSIDCAAFISDTHFVSGTDENYLQLWHVMKKKPIFVSNPAHPAAKSTQRGVLSLAAVKNGDLVATGSSDGHLRLWQVLPTKLTLLQDIPLVGAVNALHFSPDGLTLVAAVGQEPRLGRWFRNGTAKNGLAVFKILLNSPVNGS